MRFYTIFAALLIISNFTIKAQKNIHASFSGTRKNIILIISNLDSISDFKMPNTIRANRLSSEAIQVAGDTITLNFFHYKGDVINVNQGGDIKIIKVGILAYEAINAQAQKQYQFKLPRGYQNTKKFNLLILNFDNRRTFIVKRE